MLTSRVDNNVSPSIAEQETNEIVETNDNSEIDDATERTNVESNATIAAKAGRPCGTGATQVRDATNLFYEAMNEACEKHSDVRNNRLLKHGELRKSCELVEESRSLKKGIILPEKMRTRHKRNSLFPTSRGAPSPLSDVEDAPVGLFLQRGKMSEPLNCTEGLTFINSLISGSDAERKVRSFFNHT